MPCGRLLPVTGQAFDGLWFEEIGGVGQLREQPCGLFCPGQIELGGVPFHTRSSMLSCGNCICRSWVSLAVWWLNMTWKIGL